MTELPFYRPLIFVAHPDDETLACGGLLQRLPASMVVFGTDGTPSGYGLERRAGGLPEYTRLRVQEGSRALAHIPKALFQWLTRPDGSYFNDGHLFEELRDASASLLAAVRAFGPDAVVSHAYEGGHLDHEACSFIAMHVAEATSLKRFEFPLYWTADNGQVVLQQFRDSNPAFAGGPPIAAAGAVLEWQLSDAEVQCKKQMMAEYRTQHGTMATFSPERELLRVAATNRRSYTIPQCRDYLYQNRPPRFYHTRRHRLPAKAVLEKFAEFEICRQDEPARE